MIWISQMSGPIETSKAKVTTYPEFVKNSNKDNTNRTKTLGNTNQTLTFGGNITENVTGFTYLGAKVTKDANS